nr:GNAT family N-acetyltransferase [Carnobacterium maltaromaticum]
METYRLKIRPYQMTDLEAAVTFFSDAEMMTYYPAPFSKQKTMEWLEWSIKHYQRNGMGL